MVVKQVLFFPYNSLFLSCVFVYKLSPWTDLWTLVLKIFSRIDHANLRTSIDFHVPKTSWRDGCRKLKDGQPQSIHEKVFYSFLGLFIAFQLLVAPSSSRHWLLQFCCDNQNYVVEEVNAVISCRPNENFARTAFSLIFPKASLNMERYFLRKCWLYAAY